MFDLSMKNGNVVFRDASVLMTNIGVKDGKIASIGRDSDTSYEVVKAYGKFVFPRVIDSHFHLGIFRPLQEDVRSKTASAVAGCVTTILIYYRANSGY